jgi:hypothetical protein
VTLFWGLVVGLTLVALLLLGLEFMEWLEGDTEEEDLGELEAEEHARPLGNVVVLPTKVRTATEVQAELLGEEARAREAETDG